MRPIKSPYNYMHIFNCLQEAKLHELKFLNKRRMTVGAPLHRSASYGQKVSLPVFITNALHSQRKLCHNIKFTRDLCCSYFFIRDI